MDKKNVTLRPYQEEAIKAITAQAPGKYVVSLATGLGKTVTFANIPRQGRMLILSHRQELVWQPKKYFDCSYGVEIGSSKSNGEEVVSASVQSLVRRLDRFKPDDFDIIIVDECHHVMAPTYRKILKHFDKARLVLGFTATVNRADKQMLGEVFDKIIYHRDLKWGIENGYLSPIKAVRVDMNIDFDKIALQGGDFNLKALAREIDTPERNHKLVRICRKEAVGQTIIFAASISHANHLASLLGSQAVVVTGETPNREEVIKDFTERKFKYLVNCMVFTEGTDMPLIETVVIARPTCNQSLYAQMVGRGLRLAPGKEFTKVIDCVGISKKRNLCEMPHLFNIDGGNPVKFEHDAPVKNKNKDKQEMTFTPVYTTDLCEIDIVNDEAERDDYYDYAWFFTCKERTTGKVVTKILHTEDVDSSVARIRKQGFTFVTLVSMHNACKIVGGGNKRCKGIIDNMRNLGHINMSAVDYFKGLIRIENEGKVNDNIDEDLIKVYLKENDEEAA